MALSMWDTLHHTIGWEVVEESMEPLIYVRKSRHGTAVGFRIGHTFPLHLLVVTLFCSHCIAELH